MTADQRYLDDLELFGGPVEAPLPQRRGMTTGEALALAEEWAGRGVPVFPVQIGWDERKKHTAKEPLTPHGHLDASTDQRAVRLMFNRANPRQDWTLGVGIRPGPAGLMFVDVDGLDDVRRYDDRGLPPTYRVTTCSGASHFAYRKREAVQVGMRCDWAEVDVVRSDDGWVVAAGTFTPWGEWVSHDDPAADIIEAPAELWAVLDRRSGAGTSGPAGVVNQRGVDHVLGRLIAAERHQDAEALQVLLARYGAHDPFIRTDGGVYVTRPGKSAGTSASVGTVAPGLVKVFSSKWSPFSEGGRYIVADGGLVSDLDALRLEPSTTGDNPEPPHSEVRFRRWSVTELLAADLTYEWDATGLLVRPTYGMDAGELKTLKSYFGTARLVGLAAGVPILGRWAVPERRRVLAYIAEGGRIPFTRRLVRTCEAHGVDPADLDGWLEPIFDAGPLDSTPFRDSLRGHLADYQPAFVHLDPLYPFQPTTVDSHRVSEMGQMLADVQLICAAHDATFWLTAHMNQSGQGFDLKRIAGAGTGEWGDSWVLLRHREPPDVARGRFRLTADIGSRQWGGGSHAIDFNIGTFDADAGTHDGPITFHVHDGQAAETVDIDDAKRLKARRAVFATMRKARAPLTKTEIEERTTGASKVHIRAEIVLLIDEEQLVPDGVRKPGKGGRDAPLYVLSKEAGDD